MTPTDKALLEALAWAVDAQNLTVAGQQAHPWLVADIVKHAPVLAKGYRDAITERDEARAELERLRLKPEGHDRCGAGFRSRIKTLEASNKFLDERCHKLVLELDAERIR